MSASDLPTRRHKTLLVIGGGVLALLLTWRLGWWDSSSPRPNATSSRSGSSEQFGPALSLYPPGARKLSPPLTGSTLSGGHFDLAGLRGHVVVINVWGSWCGPCRHEAPILARVSHQTYSKGVRFVGLDERDHDAAARAFERSFGITYPSMVDPDGQQLLPFGQVIPINAIPSTLVLDPAGRIAARFVGEVDETTLRGVIHDTLAQADTAAGRTSVGLRGTR